VHVAAVSEPHAYLPVGIVLHRPTADPVRAVRTRQPDTAAGASRATDDAGPKLLLDLELIAPRPTDEAPVASATESEAAGRSEECSTCARRRYQDGSDDPSVSFQTPTHLSPAEAEIMVRVHEQEHVQHERSTAASEGKAVDTRVSIRYSICPECGRVYCSGGTTHVVTSDASEADAASPRASSLDVVA
jgi:hypothetical protein